ncbi:MAG: DNA repair protein RecO [Alphaproteobacteria bacterium]|nr:DNA repair protein RecO [Alphaproteobacteria bacterium]
MQIETSGILINIKPFSERDSIAHIFTRDNGVLVGLLRGAVVAKKNKPLVGQCGNVSWNARLDSQLGVFHWDAEKNLSAPLIFNTDLLKIMNSAFSLIYSLVPERESYEHLYNKTFDLLSNLSMCDNSYDLYLNWEIDLLRDLGYALDLTKCSGCHKTENLCYLSPKTGRAVCADCGAPYVDKLYKLPINLNVTKRFVDNVCKMHGIEIPMARKIL